ncbi:PTB domain (IRS-1 type) domain-containing protein [Ditylenchus destructor]|uniref:PTB domain (IRS-1 type) domain-containing protein n=1 Tax=Ditylenchus destructor TaxID=166010 RepID=A0AAD4NGV6_9BILA|nr:PTB domain (IRS-1 type) domain-containing protein [Ditylenchus destructor]
MGNCSATDHHSKLFRTENFSNDPSAFRVFIKKRNKFIPGWLKINDDEIIFTRGTNNYQFWPLAYLRRYGYTCSDIFFFESGRRCATGEGLHTFQSHQAERIFHLVQSKIKIEEFTRGSRSSSVVSCNRTNNNSINPSLTNRIHPVQRFSSEGANNSFVLSSADSRNAPAPPPYGNSVHDPRRYATQCHTVDRHCRLLSVASSHSINVRGTGYVARERPRSVVSAMGHSVGNGPSLQLPSNPSSSHVLPSSASMTGSYISANPSIMNQSYNSTICDSLWSSQQQLEGDIVLEHVLNGRHQNARPPDTLSNNVSQSKKFHNYVNVELPRTRELRRTSRQEFLSTQPGGFIFNPLSARVSSAASSASTVTTPLPPLSPAESFNKMIGPADHRQQGFRLYNGRLQQNTDPQNGIMSVSATAALSIPSPTKNIEDKYLGASGGFFDVPTTKNYTVAVARQEQNIPIKEQTVNNTKEIGLNYALIDFDKTEKEAHIKSQIRQQGLQ